MLSELPRAGERPSTVSLSNGTVVLMMPAMNRTPMLAPRFQDPHLPFTTNPLRPYRLTRVSPRVGIASDRQNQPKTVKNVPKLAKIVENRAPRSHDRPQNTALQRISPRQEKKIPPQPCPRAADTAPAIPGHPRPSPDCTLQNRPESPRIEQIRTRSNPAAFSPTEQGWTGLNKPEHPEHTITRKTLEIAPREPPKKSWAEHLNVRVAAETPM